MQISMIVPGRKASKWNNDPQTLLPGNKQIPLRQRKIKQAVATFHNTPFVEAPGWALNVSQTWLNSYFGSNSNSEGMVFGQVSPLEARVWMGMTTPINHPDYRVKRVKHFTAIKFCQPLQTSEESHQEAMWLGGEPQNSASPIPGLPQTHRRAPEASGPPLTIWLHFLCWKARKAVWTYTTQKSLLQSS